MKRLVLAIWICCCAILHLYGGTNDFPAGVPNPIGADGKYDMHAMMFTTKAYQRAALGLVIQEANKVAQELNLPETLPITQSNVVQSYISPFGISWVKKRIGNIATTNYIYYMSQGNRFSYLADMHLDAKLKEYRTRYTWPVSQIDTNAAYQLAAKFLTNVSMDVDGLNRDYSVIIKPDDVVFGRPTTTFVPVYDVYWPNGSKAGGSVAFVQVLLPTQMLLQLHVENPKYILRKPLAFNDLSELLSQTNTSSNSFIAPKQVFTNETQSIPENNYETPTNLARIISGADSILVTNRFSAQLQDYRNINLTGQDAKNVVQAVSLARQYPNTLPSNSIWDWQLRFYSGTNLLAAVYFEGRSFVSNGEFHDETGVLEKLKQDVMKQGE